MAKVTEETRLASQKLDLNIKSAQLELNKQLLEMQKSAEAIDASVKSAHKSADDANEAYQQLSDVEKKAEASGHVIESYQIQAVRAVKPHFRGFDLNNIDYQWLAGHLAF